MQSIAPNIEAITGTKVAASVKRVHIARQLTLIIPAIVLFLLVLAAIFADLSWLGLPDVRLAPYDPVKISMPERFLPPFWAEGGSTEHLLGTDNIGRDILSRVIYGSRISLSVSLLVIVITAGVGTVLGIIAGYLGGRTDGFLMRVTDVSLSFPPILLALLLAATMGPGYWTVVLALSILGWAPYARLIRGEALKLREEDFVGQARVIGASPIRIMIRHIFPNIINPLIIMMTLSVGMVILTEAALSYLGAGIPPPNPSWGNMVNDGRSFIDTAWWIATFPGIAIGLVVLSGNFMGDWLRDTMDPRLRQL
jgi:peptide/nickel transport system permease protein